MQKRVQELSERFKNELGRYYYVTPTSYLILINTFKTKLKTKRDIIYAFQRKVLGEELKEIINAILEYDLKVDELSGRVTKVHVTKLLFINM